MSVLTSIIIAEHSEALRVAEAANPTELWEGIDAKGMDPVKLCSLYAILAACDPDAVLSLFDQLAGSDEGPWVMRTPPDLPELLASISDPDQVAQQWAETEEFRIDNWPLNAVKDSLAELTRIASMAQAQGKPLVMWMSL